MVNRRLRRIIGLTLALSLSLVSAATFLSYGGVRPAGADTTPFVPGDASAAAQVLAVPLALAGENEGVIDGLSSSDYTDLEGQAESQLAASGLLADLEVPLPAQLLPLQAESTSANTSSSRTVAGASGEGGGIEAVDAAQSAALATTTMAGFNAANEIVVGSGVSTTSTSIVGGVTRQAEATTNIASLSLDDGLIVLSGLQWTSMQRTGADPTASSTFSIAGVKVAGTSLPVTNDSLQAILTSVNTALATTGISLQMPKVTTGSDGSVTETPLSIGLDHSALGKEIFGPVVSTIQPLRNAIFNELAAIYPGSGDGDLFTEIVLGILAGQGSLDLDLGGTYAASDGTTYSNPFGDSPTAAPSTIGSSGSGLNGDATTGPGTSGEISPGDALVPADGGGSGSSGALATSPSASAPKQVALQRLGSSSSCRSTTVGSCRISDAKPVALLLLLATAALCVAEFVRQRRRKRMFMAAKPSGEAP